MRTKTCTKCGYTGAIETFSKDASKASGYGSLCKPCSAEKRRQYHQKNKNDPEYKARYQERNSAYREENKERSAEYTKSWVAANKERVKAIKAKSKAKLREETNRKLREKSAATPGWQNDRAVRWRKNNPDKARAALQKRRKAVVQATPVWFGELDNFVFAEANKLAVLRERVTGVKWHVDHVLPLRGKRVCGLHTWSNVAVIPALENIRKGNREAVQ